MSRWETSCAAACGVGPCRGLCVPPRGREDMRRNRALLRGLSRWLDENVSRAPRTVRRLMRLADRTLAGDSEARREFCEARVSPIPFNRADRRAWRRVLRWYFLAADWRV